MHPSSAVTSGEEDYGSAQIWVPLAVLAAATMLLRGGLPAGVLLPEQLDPGLFLEELSATGYPLAFTESATWS